MKSVYVITMWSGGKPAKKWKAEEEPQLIAQGAGVRFISLGTRLPVQIIGSISVEEFESGKEEFENTIAQQWEKRRETEAEAEQTRPFPPDDSPKNVEPLF